MSISRWNPLQEIATVRDTMDRFFIDPFFQPMTFNGGKLSVPSLDMMERDNELVVQATVPGYEPEQIDVSVQGDTLTLRGTTNSEREQKDENYHLRERQMGSFHRSVRLPASVNADEASAEYHNGVLTLRLPKTEASSVKRIKVNH